MIIAFLIILLIQSGSFSQKVITGTVNDENGNPLPAVNVYLELTYEGTSSDADGIFKFKTNRTGHYTLVAQTIGYEVFKTEINLDNLSARYEIVLEEKISSLNAISITAGVMEASEESRAVVLRPIDVVTTPAAMGDIVGAFQTLPGTSTVGNDGRLFVRGGDASETAIFVDGLKVENAFGTTAPNVPARTRFNPNLFKGSFFSTGGYSAEYGQALSSVLALKTVDIPLRTQTDISLMTVGGGVSHTQVWDNRSLIASANILDLKPYHYLAPQNFDWERSPYGLDAELSLRQQLGNGGMVKGYLYSERGGMSLWSRDGIGDQSELIELDNRYTYGQTSGRFLISDLILRGGFSFSQNRDNYLIEDFDFNTNHQLYHTKLVAEMVFSSRFTLKTGIESSIRDYTETYISENVSRQYTNHQYNVFTEADYIISNSLVVRGGLRVGHRSPANQSWLQPRVSFAYNLPKDRGQISMAGGWFNQAAEPEFQAINKQLKSREAQHVILNYMLSRNNRTIRAELFHKNYENLLTYEGERFRYQNIQQQGDGFAQGIDVLFRDQATFDGTEFWVSYSFINSRRKYAGFSRQVQPSFAPRHNGSAVIKKFISPLKSQLGASLNVNDGYPYTDPNKPGEMNARTKPFANLSLSWSYLPKPNIIIHVASSNIPGRDNIFGYEFTPDQESQGAFEAIPIRQTAPRFLMLGIFITFSGDKNANQLNNL